MISVVLVVILLCCKLQHAAAEEAGGAMPSNKTFIGQDGFGHFHINTSSPDQDVIINGRSFNGLASTVDALQQEMEVLKSLLGVAPSSDSSTSDSSASDSSSPPAPSSSTGASPSPTGSSGVAGASVVEVYNNSVYITASNGVFFSTGETHSVSKAEDGAWDTAGLPATPAVGDFLEFAWSTLDRVFETDAEGMPLADGYSSGEATEAGVFRVRLREPRAYHFGTDSSEDTVTVTAAAIGLPAGAAVFQSGGVSKDDAFSIVGWGEDHGGGCSNIHGAMYEEGASCLCAVGERKIVFYDLYDDDRLFFCVLAA